MQSSKLSTQWSNWSKLELRNSLFIIKEYSRHSKFHHCSLYRSFNASYTEYEVFYPDLDTGASGSTQPVSVGTEAEGIDGVTTVQGVEVLALIQVPQHGLTILEKKKISLNN